MKSFLSLILLTTTVVVSFAALEGAARLYFWAREAWSVRSELAAIAEESAKPEASANIYYFGGSTMEGVIPGVSIPSVVQAAFSGEVGGVPIRSFNLAKSGKDLEYNLRKLARIVEERDVYKPSAAVIYSGHNEFLKFHPAFGSLSFQGAISWLIDGSRLLQWMAARFGMYRFEAGERSFFDQQLFPEADYEQIVSGYSQRLIETVELLRANKIPVVVSTVAGNDAEWEPNRSTYCSHNANRDEFAELIDAGRRAANGGRHDDAIDAYQRAADLCYEFAETHYQLGLSYEALGHHEQAAQSYFEAVTYDRMPIRALPKQNDVIRAIRQDDYVVVADAVEAVRQHAEHGLVGFNLMIDGHHPNPSGYTVIGEAIGDALRRLLDSGSEAPSSEPGEQDPDITLEEALDDQNLFDTYVWNGGWFARLSTWRFDPKERLKLAEQAFMRAKDLYPERHEAYLGLATVELMRKDRAAAQNHLAKARRIDEHEVSAYLDKPWIKAAMKYASEPTQ